MAPTRDGGGYWLIAGDGGVFTFGNATFLGSLGSTGSTEPVVGLLPSPSSAGYWIVTTGHLAATPTSRPNEIHLGDGTYRVGMFAVRAGDYREQYAQPGCHWERITGFTGDPGDVEAMMTSDSRQVVTLKDGDTFRTIGCAPWTSDIFPVTQSLYSDFGDGDWVVGTDVGPGVWTAPGGTNCRWTVVSDFSGSSDSIKAMDDLAVNPRVVLDSADRGFTTAGCGVWRKG
jgi:hypothetical protein